MTKKQTNTLTLPAGAKGQKREPSIGFIGAGRVARALGIALHRAGYAVTAVASRTLASAKLLATQIDGCTARRDSQAVVDACQLVFITTPDDTIPAAIAHLKWHPGQTAVHCSGADSVALLRAAACQGITTGVFHPLQAFTGDKTDANAFQGITFSIEAEEPLRAKLKDMACALGGYWIVLSAEDKALYHASAVIACNYMVTLAGIAASLWANFGADTEEATRALLPIMKHTVANIEHLGLPDCLTGPIARGDAGTVRRHLQAIRARAPGLEPTYRELGQLTVSMAHAAGRLDAATVANLTAALAE